MQQRLEYLESQPLSMRDPAGGMFNHTLIEGEQLQEPERALYGTTLTQFLTPIWKAG